MNNPLLSMKRFTLVWAGQLASQLGTEMTRFALIIWAYDLTGDATTLAMLGFFAFGAKVLFSPLAGVLVDRWDRRRILIVTDLAAGLVTMALLLLHLGGRLVIAHLYLAEALVGALDAFWRPAYTAAITQLVPRQQYGRANGMRSLSCFASQVAAPPLAGLALAAVGLNGVLLIDVATFLCAVSALLAIRLPALPRDAVSAEGQGSFRREMIAGFRYIRQRRGLLALLLLFVAMNFLATLTYFAILPAMVLARSGGHAGGSEGALAGVQAALGLGGVIGGLLMSVWGGPRRRIHGVLLGAALSFFCGDLLFAVGRTPLAWAVAGFLSAFFIPPITSSSLAIWQAKVPPGMQGRVFAVQNMVGEMLRPLGYLLAGPLADRVFEPAMRAGGSLAPLFGGLLGTGPGAGMALMFLFTGVTGTLLHLGGYLVPTLRRVEIDLPDHDTPPLQPVSAPVPHPAR